MSAEIRYERIIDAPPEEVFDAFTSPGGQLAFYGQDDPGWIVHSDSELRVGGAWTIRFGPSIEAQQVNSGVWLGGGGAARVGRTRWGRRERVRLAASSASLAAGRRPA